MENKFINESGLLKLIQLIKDYIDKKHLNNVTGVKGNNEANYRTGNVNITKSNIGLSEVDNTSDVNKPISNATQLALDLLVVDIDSKSFDKDPTVPDWVKSPTKPEYTASEVGALPDDTFIPTKVSDLENDSGLISTETDPTVPSWAKQPTKPSYSYNEITNTPTIPTVPTNVSAFTNDAGYLTEHQDISSKAEEFIVSVSYNGSAYSADKTPEQCCAAFNGGKRVIFQSMSPLPNDGGSQTYVATSVMASSSTGSYSVYAVGSVNDNSVSVLKYQKSTITGTMLSMTNFDLRVVNNLTSTSTTSALSAKQGKDLKGLVDGKQDTLVSGTTIKTINSTSLLGSGNIAVTTPGDLATYCPIIEDTRQSAVAAITGVAPFASLVDGQRIVLKMKYNTTGTNPMPTLELSLSNNTTTGQKALYFLRNNALQRVGLSNFQIQLINSANYVAYIEMTYSASMDGWFCDYNYWYYTQYSTITQAQIDAGTATTSVAVTPKLLRGNFYLKSEINTMIGDIETLLASI